MLQLLQGDPLGGPVPLRDLYGLRPLQGKNGRSCPQLLVLLQLFRCFAFFTAAVGFAFCFLLLLFISFHFVPMSKRLFCSFFRFCLCCCCWVFISFCCCWIFPLFISLLSAAAPAGRTCAILPARVSVGLSVAHCVFVEAGDGGGRGTHLLLASSYVFDHFDRATLSRRSPVPTPTPR